MILINQIVQGILLGGYYALIACGLSFMFGIMRIINLAHGTLAVASAYALYVLAETYELSPFIGLLVVLPAMAALGAVLQLVVLERSSRSGLLVPILSTFGLAVFLENILFVYFGADTRSLAPYIGTLAYDAWSLSDDIDVGKLATIILLVALIELGSIHLLLLYTHIGRAIRATTEDPDTAGLVGVNARAVRTVATSIAIVTVGIAGAALGLRGTFDTYSGSAQLIFAFEATVIGGAGSLWGTLLGGIALGVVQNVGAIISPQGFLLAGHGMFLLIVVVRVLVPSGGFGSVRRSIARYS